MTDVASLKMLYSIFTDNINAITSEWMTIKMFLKNPKKHNNKKTTYESKWIFLMTKFGKVYALRYNNPLIRDKIEFPSLYKIDQSKDSFC